MPLISFVASHADLDLETIARLSEGASALPAQLLTDEHIDGVVSVATCNRYELYLDVPADAMAQDVLNTVATAIADAGESKHNESTANAARSSFRVLEGEQVVEHLFAVVSGLDSAVVGEREIAGQARRALTRAQAQNESTGALVRLFQAAARTSKQVAASTSLGKRGRSIVSVALDLADEVAELPLGKNRAVVLGTGAYAGATIAALRDRGCEDIGVFSSSGRAEDFATSRKVTALTEAELPEAIGSAGLIIGCSGSGRRITADRLRGVLTAGQPIIMIDLALARDFDPDVVELADVELITLESVRMAAPTEATMPVLQAMDIVSDAARDFHTQQTQREVDSAIVALRRHTMGVLEAEMERVRAQHGCTAAADEVEFAMRRMVRSLLHVPTMRAKELAARGEQSAYVEGLKAVYGIDATTTTPASDVEPVAQSLPLATPKSERTHPDPLTCPAHGATGTDGPASCPFRA